MQENSVKYQTVEGCPISEGDLVETRGGEKVFITKLAHGYVGGVKQGFRAARVWFPSGFIYPDAMELEPKRYHNDDLMRPWVEKEGVEKCKECNDWPLGYRKCDHIVDKDEMVDDGWVLFEQGSNPVSTGTWLDLRLKDGSTWKNAVWNIYFGRAHGELIHSYRIVKPTTEKSSDVEGTIPEKETVEEVVKENITTQEIPKKYSPLFVTYTGFKGEERSFWRAIGELNEPLTINCLGVIERELILEGGFDSVTITNFKRIEDLN